MYKIPARERQRPIRALFCCPAAAFPRMISAMSMHSHIAEWDLHDADIMPETRTSKLCRVTTGFGQAAVLKYLKPIGVVDEAGGAALLEYYNGSGAVRIIRYDTEAHLLEYADSRDLLHATDDGAVSDEQAARIAAEMVKQLHAPRPDTKRPETLIPLESRLNEIYNRAAIDSREGKSGTAFQVAANVASHLLKTTRARDILPLHGDLHHENIVRSSERGWLAIDPKGLVGDRAYDVSNMFSNPLGRTDITLAPGRAGRLADIFSETLGYDRTRILAWGAVHAALSASWSLLENRPAEAEATLKVAESILDILPPLRQSKMGPPAKTLEPAQ